MAGGITMAQALDLTTGTLAKFDKDDVIITLGKRTREAASRWWPKRKVLGGGKKVQWDILLKDSSQGEFTRNYATYTPNVENLVSEGTADWVKYKTSFSYSLDDIAINRDNPTRIFDILKTRRESTIIKAADDLETWAWRTPTSSSDDLHPLGIFSWLCQADADTSTGDFYGYLPDYTTGSNSESGFSTVAGLSCTSTTNARWANWYADHNDNLDYTLLKLMSKAMRQTGFQTPAVAGESVDPKSDFYDFTIYTCENVIETLEDMAIKADDNVGADLGKYQGAVTYKNIPLRWVEQLDDPDSILKYVCGGNPILGVNHKWFYPVTLSDFNFKWDAPISGGVTQNDVLTVFLTVYFQYVCKNRRQAGWLISDWEDSN